MNLFKYLKRTLGLLITIIAITVLMGAFLAADTTLKPIPAKDDNYKLVAQAFQGEDATEVYLKISNGLSRDKINGVLQKVYICALDRTCRSSQSYQFKDIPVSNGTAVIELNDIPKEWILAVDVSFKQAILNKRTIRLGACSNILLKPDLAFENVSVPDYTASDNEFTLSANLVEKNGDVGSTADVDVYNGATLLAAEKNIQITAGGTKQLVFKLKLHDPGDYQLKIKASNTNPSDFDPSNNEATCNIKVTNPSIGMQCASEYEHYYIYRYDAPVSPELPSGETEYSTDTMHMELTNSSQMTPTGLVRIKVAAENGRAFEIQRNINEFSVTQENEITHYHLTNPEGFAFTNDGNYIDIYVDSTNGTKIAYQRHVLIGKNDSALEPYHLNAEQKVTVTCTLDAGGGSQIGGVFDINLEKQVNDVNDPYLTLHEIRFKGGMSGYIQLP